METRNSPLVLWEQMSDLLSNHALILLKLSYHCDSKSVSVIISSNIYFCKPPKHFIYFDYWLDILKFESMESKFQFKVAILYYFNISC